MVDSELDGKSLAFLLTSTTEAGEDDWAVFGGTARSVDGVLYLDRGQKGPRVLIPREWADRIKPVDAGVKDVLLGADYYLMRSVGSLPPEADLDQYFATGLQWPK